MRLPLKIIRHSESFEIRDADLTNIAYIYFADTLGRRMNTKRMAEDEAKLVAKQLS